MSSEKLNSIVAQFSQLLKDRTLTVPLNIENGVENFKIANMDTERTDRIFDDDVTTNHIKVEEAAYQNSAEDEMPLEESH